MTGVHAVVDAYVAALNDGDVDTLLALFTPTARLRNPFGVFDGHDEIGGFYRDVVLAADTEVTVGDLVAGDGLVMCEVAGRSRTAPDAGTAEALDVFRFDEGGRITGLDIYYR